IYVYDDQIKINERITKENDFFLKKWNQRNILDYDKKDKIIKQQFRLAATGEMIDAVAHQWKQPLNALSMMIDMLRDDFKSGDVNNAYIDDLERTTFGNKNELKHLFINLINNSIDAFNERNISNRKVDIRCYSEDNRIYIEVEDNAGGIPKNIINNIFKPNVTTKAEGKGTDIGLYMSSQIASKNNGTINVYNTESGAFFTIILHQPTI
ncbi:MAG: HAMP domain-containing histidine kinase, partial [Sulfurimonas sp.]|nr:HAMP domain-containing histidine kinase [Sulfurimonas sp.]